METAGVYTSCLWSIFDLDPKKMRSQNFLAIRILGTNFFLALLLKGVAILLKFAAIFYYDFLRTLIDRKDFVGALFDPRARF